MKSEDEVKRERIEAMRKGVRHVLLALAVEQHDQAWDLAKKVITDDDRRALEESLTLTWEVPHAAG